MPRYQLCSKNIFLTYAQCTLTKENVLQKLKELIGEQASIRVGHELHQDGGHHLHCFISNPENIRTRDPRYFDLEGFHPNFQSARQRKNCYTYCGKDDDYVECGPPFEFKEDKRKWDEIENAQTPDEVRDIVKAASYRDYVLNFEKIETFIRFKFQDRVIQYSSIRDITDFTIPQEMLDWTEQMNEVSIRGDYVFLPYRPG